MKFFMYCEPAGANSSEPVWTIMSERAILEGEYWRRWCEQMKASGNFLYSNVELMRAWCLDEFCLVNWAVEATPEELAKVISQAPNPDKSAA